MSLQSCMMERFFFSVHMIYMGCRWARNTLESGCQMKRKLLGQSLLIFMLAGILVWVDFIVIDFRSQQKLQLVKTYVASHDIPPRTKIQEGDVLEMVLPKSYLGDYAVHDIHSIIGKWTDIEGMIPAGSFFYTRMLKAEEDLPDSPVARLKEGQSAYTMQVDLNRIGGGTMVGMRVDIYGTIIGKDGHPIAGPLISNVRVLSIRDHQGMEISDPDSSGLPYIAVVAVKDADVPILAAVEQAGELRFVSSSRSYSGQSEAVLMQDSSVVAWYQDN